MTMTEKELAAAVELQEISDLRMMHKIAQGAGRFSEFLEKAQSSHLGTSFILSISTTAADLRFTPGMNRPHISKSLSEIDLWEYAQNEKLRLINEIRNEVSKFDYADYARRMIIAQSLRSVRVTMSLMLLSLSIELRNAPNGHASLTALLTGLDDHDARSAQRAAMRHIGGHEALYADEGMTFSYASKISLGKKQTEFAKRVEPLLKSTSTVSWTARRSAANDLTQAVA